MERTLILMCGIPGAGKSYFVKTHAELAAAAYVSRDEIRFKHLLPDEPYFAHEKESYTEFVDTIKKALQEKEVVVADATHLNVGSRAKLLRALGDSLKGVRIKAIVISSSVEKAIEHNELRKDIPRAYVPQDAIINMSKSFTFPSLEEGFDEIYIYKEGARPRCIAKGD